MPSDFIPLSVPHLAGNEWSYIKDCLDTGWVSSVGSYVDRFEREFAAKVGAKAAIACASGTAALHVSLLVAGVKPDDAVVLSTLTFIAPANTIRYVNAWPVLIDAEPRYLQMDVAKLGDYLENGCRWEGKELRDRKTSRRVSAIIPVHILGHPCEMDPILALADRYRLAVIEDATESLGSRYKGRPTGTMGSLGCFSFNGNKIITTGSGGMIVTDDLALAKHAKHLTTQAKQDALEFVHDEVGYNYRLSNISAAFGVAQLEKIDAYKSDKRRIAACYDAAFESLPGIRTPEIAPWADSNEWLYTIRINAEAFGIDSRTLMRRLKDSGIETRPLWQPMHRSPAHRKATAWRCEEADLINDEALSIPCSVGLKPEEQTRVIDLIREAHKSAQ